MSPNNYPKTQLHHLGTLEKKGQAKKLMKYKKKKKALIDILVEP
jgi:hypothetical protein